MKLKIILITLLVSITCIGLLLTITLRKDDKTELCPKLVVDVKSIGEKNYVTSEMVINLLNNKHLNPENKFISEVSTNTIREIVESNLSVKKAKCYFAKNGNFKIDVIQRKPFFKVVGEKNYYVEDDDNSRTVFVTSPDFNAEVPVVTGKFADSIAQKDIFDLIKFLQDDKFLSKFAAKINVENSIVKITSHDKKQIIIVGKLRNSAGVYDFEKKLERLKKFYSKDVIEKVNLEKYSEIDLRFDKQVICR